MPSSQTPSGQAPSGASSSQVPPVDVGAEAQPRRRRRRGCLWLLALLTVAYVGWEAATWPDVAWYADHDPNTSAFVERYRRRAKRQGLPAPRQRWIAYRSISRNLKQAVVAAEDMEFFDHHGFSSHELQAALEDAWEEKTLPRGASTISQQVAKNLWLSPSYNPLRKVKEAVLTWQLERNLSKRRILELYLNFAEFGPGTYGAEAAARRYFGTSATRLSAGQSAQLAAGLSRPRTWHPGASSRSYQRRVRIVLRRMAQARWILRNV
ncbi:MAG TPA: monofunctional biosynthetic peptidoglycan transglycosylase [Thermoanaerobaculia bacterium]|nr:monofunctional biosynthetic peptidoglycan transglycosylase [Thermoanaerobaculia bacterium]